MIKKLIGDSGNTSRLKALIQGKNEVEKITSTLRRLRIFANEIPFDHAKPIFDALCEVTEELPFVDRGMFGVQADAHASRCLHEFFMQEIDVATRGQAALDALVNTTTLWLPVEFVADLSLIHISEPTRPY